MTDHAAKFLVALGAFALAVLCAGGVLAFYRDARFDLILVGAIVVVVAFLLISFLFAMIVWVGAYLLLGDQTRDTLRNCYVYCAFGVALVFALLCSYDLYRLNVIGNFFKPENSDFAFSSAVALCAPYVLLWMGIASFHTAPETPEQAEQRRTVEALQHELKRILNRKQTRLGQLLSVALGALVGGLIGYLVGGRGIHTWLPVAIGATMGLVGGMFAFRYLPNQKRLREIEKSLKEHRGY